MEIKKILFPVDLTGFSFKIVPQVLSMAHKFGAEIHLLFVVGTMKEYSTFFVPHPSLDLFEMQNVTAAQKKLEEFYQEYLIEYPKVKSVVLNGHPVEEIIKYLASAGIDLIMIATHGRHGLERALFGSVADEIVTGSRVPVMCINPGMEAEKKKEIEKVFPITQQARRAEERVH
jgi:nucleotide-binding universal stress UspA family protein